MKTSSKILSGTWLILCHFNKQHVLLQHNDIWPSRNVFSNLKELTVRILMKLFLTKTSAICISIDRFAQLNIFGQKSLANRSIDENINVEIMVYKHMYNTQKFTGHIIIIEIECSEPTAWRINGFFILSNWIHQKRIK